MFKEFYFLYKELLVGIALKQLRIANKQGDNEAIRYRLQELQNTTSGTEQSAPEANEKLEREIKRAEHVLEINTIRQRMYL